MKKHQHIVGNKSRNIRQKNKKDPIIQATTTNSNGQIYQCTNNFDMIAAMAKSNLSRQQQSANTLLMTEPLLSNFGYQANKNLPNKGLNGTYVPPPNTPKYVGEFLAILVMPEAIRKLGPVDLSISQSDNSTSCPKRKASMGLESTTLNFNHCMSHAQIETLTR